MQNCRFEQTLIEHQLATNGAANSTTNVSLDKWVMNKYKLAQNSLEWTQIVLPAICTIGMTGNFLNLLVLTRKRMRGCMGKLERSANVGLTALALSDLGFNIAVFPHAFVRGLSQIADETHVYVLYYRLYGIACINLFLMVSTWLIVVLAMERYVVLFYPLRAKNLLGVARTRLLLLGVYVISGLFSLPFFIQVYMSPCQTRSGKVMYEAVSRWDELSPVNVGTKRYVTWVWPFVSVFIPLALLCFCNVRLLQGLRKVSSARRQKCPGQHIKEVNSKITLTLIIIVFMAILLVAPCEILRFINPYNWGPVGHVLANVANVLQAINFAFNFILYCAIDATFRRVCRSMLMPPYCMAKQDDSRKSFVQMRGGSCSVTHDRMSDTTYSQNFTKATAL